MLNKMTDRNGSFRKLLGAVGGALLFADGTYVTMIGALLILWAFFEDFGNLTLWVFDDRCTNKAYDALKKDPHASVNAFHAHQVALRQYAERQHRTFRQRIAFAWEQLLSRVKAFFRPIELLESQIHNLELLRQTDSAIPFRMEEV
jgi:hypothetical protein